MLCTSSGDYDGLVIVGLLCMVVDGLGMVGLSCTLVNGLVRLVSYLFWDIGLLRQADGLEMSLDCEVGMQLVGFWQLFT